MTSISFLNLSQFGNKLITVLNSVVFLYVLSVGSLVPPSILPSTSALGVVFLLTMIILNLSSALGLVDNNKKIYFVKELNYSNILSPIIGLSLLFILVFCLTATVGFNFLSSFASLVLHVGFLVFILNTRDYLLYYLKAYLYLVIVMAFCGLLASFLLTFGFADPSSFVNISDMTDGSFSRDEDMIGSYLFPYNLGFILTGGGKLSLLGFEFFRISGWAHEPTSATLFVAPSIILLLHTKVIMSNFLRFGALALIASFWIFALSVGSLFAFVILYFFYITITLYIKIFPLKLTLSIIFTLFSLALFLSFNIEGFLNSTLLTSKLNLSAQTFQVAISRLMFYLPSQAHSSLNSFTFLFIYSIIFFFLLNILYSFLREKDLNPFALIPLYIIIHSMKGSQDSVFLLTNAFFWFYISYFSMSYGIVESVKVQKFNLSLLNKTN